MDSSPSTAVHHLMVLYAGQSVPFHFNWGFIALSYLVSLIGAGSTLELINRRTSIKGLYNHVLLFGAAISMGGIAIWSMHYIANRAIIILDNQVELQIAYSPGITAASFFVPILVLILAFLGVGTTSDSVIWWRLALAGTLSGGAICGMHYLGNASIRNYHCVYAPANVVGAAVIAVSASSVALALFFVFRAAWSVSWPRRAGCMAVLAGAVSGMHWCAALGTSYVLRAEAPRQGGPGDSRTSTVVVVIFLAVAAAAIMLLAAMLTARTMRRYANKAQQITLAAAVFDGHGRILVSPDGLLPSERVTETFPQRGHDDVFSLAHPLFHWMYRASRNWSSVAALLPWMVAHLDALPHHHDRSKTPLFQENGQLVEGYDVIFRELFCLAASTLAGRMAEDVVNMGTLWDEIFHTGTEARPGTRMSATLDAVVSDAAAARWGSRSDDEASRLERGLARADTYGQGCVMFLVRHVPGAAAAAKLEAAGFRFADPHRVADIIKSSMQIKTPRLEATLRDMAAHTTGLEGLVVPGLHVGLFAVRARLDKFGFDVVVDAATRSTLPSRALPYRALDAELRDVLARLAGLPLQTLLLRLASLPDASPRQVEFAGYLRAALARLRADLDDDPALDGATLAPAVVQVPCLQRPAGADGDGADAGRGPAATASLLTLQLVLDINARFRCPRAAFVPLQFLKVRQLVADNAPHHAAFSRALHREMSAVMAVLPPSLPPAGRKTRSGGGADSPRPASQSSSTRKLKEAATPDEDYPPVPDHHHPGFPHPAKHASSFDDDDDDDDDISNDSRGATLAPPPSRDPAQSAKPSLFGGIMVSNEIAIQVDEVKPQNAETGGGGGGAYRPHHEGDDRGEVSLARRLRYSWALPAATAVLRPAATRLRRHSRPATARTATPTMGGRRATTRSPLPQPPPPPLLSAPPGLPIELALRSPTTAALYGSSVGGGPGTGVGINVAAQEKEADTSTYIDELFAACMEKRM